jgi:flagellar protein FlaG
MIHRVTFQADLLATRSRGSEPVEGTAKEPSPARKHPGSEQAPSAPFDRAAIDRAVAKVSEVLDTTDPRLKIEIDDETKRVVVKIVQEDSGEVIRQIPPEELLKLEKYLASGKGILLKEQA